MNPAQDRSTPILFSEEHLRKMNLVIRRLASKLHAPLVMLTDISGQKICFLGSLSATKGTGLGVLSAGGFAAGVEIGNYLGLINQHGFDRLLLEGQRANLYVTLVGEETLLITAFTRKTTLGKARVFIGKAKKELGKIIEVAIQEQHTIAVPTEEQIDTELFHDIETQLEELF